MFRKGDLICLEGSRAFLEDAYDPDAFRGIILSKEKTSFFCCLDQTTLFFLDLHFLIFFLFFFRSYSWSPRLFCPLHSCHHNRRILLFLLLGA